MAVAVLSLVLGGALSERLGHGRAGVLALSPGAASHAVGPHRGLMGLPVAAQGPISGKLGVDSHAYRVSASGGGFRAASPAQRLRVRFDRAGVTLSSGAVKLALSTRAIGYGTSLRALEPVAPTAKANRVSYARAGMSEWYVNGPLGLEQGFTLARAPSGHGGGLLTLSMALSGDARASLVAGAQSIALDRAGAPSLHYGGLLATDARGRTLHSWLELRGATVLLRVNARGALYPLRIDPLIQQGSKLSAGSEGLFGTSVAMSADGNTALIGAPRANGYGGIAWVFARQGTEWKQQGEALTGSEQSAVVSGEQCGEEPGEEEGECGFGSSVALSADGNTALIGGPRDSGYVGAAWAFTREGSTWSQQGPKLTAGGATSKSRFGRSVALSADGNTALIGAPAVATGAALVFTREGSTWKQQGEALTGGEHEGPGHFGRSVALSADGNTALIGGPSDSHYVGAAWAFARSGSAWMQLGHKLTGSEEQGNGHFGYSVALSADAGTALFGGLDDHEGVGAAWAFARSGSAYAQQGTKLTGGEEGGEGKFGSGVALSGDGTAALVGGLGDSGRLGAAWLFARSGTSWSESGERPEVDDEVGNGWLGASVALSGSGGTLIVGGPRDSSRTGAAWVFAQVASAPAVRGVNPNTGPAAGGTTVTVTGENFTGATAVSFGETETSAASFTINSSSSITAVAPEGAGTVPVRVTTPAGTSLRSAADQFTYESSKGGKGVRPVVAKASPEEGSTAGGTLVTITGSNLGEASAVGFGSTSAASFTVRSSTEIIAVTRSAPPGTVVVKVTTPLGNSGPLGARFTFIETSTPIGGAPGTIGTGPGGGVLGFGPFVVSSCTVALRGKTIAVQSYKRASVKLSWAGVGTCKGKLQLAVKTKIKHPKRGHKRFTMRTIGTGAFSIAPGAVRTVKVNLNKLGRSLLKARHGRLNASIAITKLSPGTAAARTASVRLALQKPVKAKKRKK